MSDYADTSIRDLLGDLTDQGLTTTQTAKRPSRHVSSNGTTSGELAEPFNTLLSTEMIGTAIGRAIDQDTNPDWLDDALHNIYHQHTDSRTERRAIDQDTKPCRINDRV